MTDTILPDGIIVQSGVWVDSWWGQYAPARALQLAHAFGAAVDPDALDAAERHIATMGPSDAPEVSPEDHDIIIEALDRAEGWLNTLTTDGVWFGWSDGNWGAWVHDEEGYPL